ncbi:Gfo/Idh/MocA family oxidoreductase [Reinekea sp.]|jgi:scyllo-inositol 2-dehydrogenase (NADP+)|uniref:Gfo/Idh/MocA family oxidoreductase n=1 Tax=Reinekea sp. TaxID=1970455 RepID=UPI00398983B2
MIRTVVIGHGFSAQTFHVPFLLASRSFIWKASVSSKPDAIALDYPQVTVLASINDISAEEYDLAIVTTPNALHFEQVNALLKLGLHVVVEKPMVLNLVQAKKLYEVAEQNKKTLTVFQNRRWDGDFLTVESLMQANRVGKLGRFVSRFDRFRPVVRDRWRESSDEGAGILWDLGPHLLDQMVALFGKPKAITANVSHLRPGALADDVFELWCHYAEFEVVLGSSCYQAGPNLRFSVEGDKGSFIKYGLDVQEEALKKGVDIHDERWGIEPESDWGVLYGEASNQIITTKPGSYEAFWFQLANAITAGGASPVPKADVLTVIELIEMAHLSAQQKRTINLS